MAKELSMHNVHIVPHYLIRGAIAATAVLKGHPVPLDSCFVEYLCTV